MYINHLSIQKAARIWKMHYEGTKGKRNRTNISSLVRPRTKVGTGLLKHLTVKNPLSLQATCASVWTLINKYDSDILNLLTERPALNLHLSINGIFKILPDLFRSSPALALNVD